ncbi:alternative ribosome rescue aminoacyl-tRNA hydrolase ArfB [Patescibacteria group bacterium]
MAFKEGQPRYEREAPEPPRVSESELDIDFVRSSGPGGQKVNKTSSKAQLRWNVGESGGFTDAQKEAIREVAGNRLNGEDEIVLSAEIERSQLQNKSAVIKRLNEIVEEALTPKKERKETRVSRTQKKKRLDEKRRTGEKKQNRKKPRQGDW